MMNHQDSKMRIQTLILTEKSEIFKSTDVCEKHSAVPMPQDFINSRINNMKSHLQHDDGEAVKL